MTVVIQIVVYEPDNRLSNNNVKKMKKFQSKTIQQVESRRREPVLVPQTTGNLDNSNETRY